MADTTSVVSRFFRLSFGLIASQVINILGIWILPHLYSPSQFAQYGVFTAIVFIVIELINLRLDIVVQLCNEEERVLMLSNAIFIAVVLSAICFLVTMIVAYLLQDDIYLLLCIPILSYGISQPLLAYCNKQNAINYINNYRLISSILNFSIAIVVSLVVKKNMGLILGFVIAQAIGTLYLMYTNAHLYSSINFSMMFVKDALRKYSQFYTFGSASAIFNSISRNSLPLFIQYLFGANNCGQYTLSTRILQTPAGIYQNAMSQVFLQYAPELSAPELRKYITKILITGTLLGILPMLAVVFFAPTLFTIFFPEQWLSASVITQYLVIWYFVGAVISPVALLLDIKQKLHIEFYWNLCLLLARIIVVFVGQYYFNFGITVLALSSIGVLFNIGLIIYVWKLSSIEDASSITA